MTTPAVGSAVFVDTNVLVYAAVATSPWHAAALASLQTHRRAGDRLWISTQVVREFAAVVTSPRFLPVPLPPVELQAAVRFFYRHFALAEDTGAVSRELLRLAAAHGIVGRRVHDVNLVATCAVWQIPALLTNNVQDFATFASPTFQILPLVSTASAGAA